MPVDTSAAVERLMRFLSVNGITGQEAKIAKQIQATLKESGIAPKMMRYDDANTRIPLPTQTGNLIVQLPGNGSLKTAPRLLFMTHMDTVPLCAGAQPLLKGKKIVNQANTALGGDNRTGCAVLATLAAELMKQKPDHPPITLFFSVREESGLYGARNVKLEDLGDVTMGYNFDGREVASLIVGAAGADRWEVEIKGKASHAGVHPDHGISATLILSLALADVYAQGYFGKVIQDIRMGTSNIGAVSDGKDGPGGQATNVVTDYLHVKGESRSHDPKFVREITQVYKKAFADAAAKVTDHAGKPGKTKFISNADYHPFRLKDDLEVVQRSMAAVKALGLEPHLDVTNGGLDANWMNKHGIPTVTFGAGQNEIHTVKEWIDLPQFEKACELAYNLAIRVE